MSRKELTPDNQPEVETTTAVAEPPAADASQGSQSFVSRFVRRQKSAAPDPFGIATDFEAGVRLLESKRDRQMAFKFGEGRPEDKPSQAVIDLLKAGDYRWNPRDRIWAHPVRQENATITRVEAGWLFDEIRHLIREEKGLDTGKGVPF